MLSQQRGWRRDRRSETLHVTPAAVGRLKHGGKSDVAALFVELGHKSKWENALYRIDGPGDLGNGQRVFLEFGEVVGCHREIAADAALTFENVWREHLEAK